MNGSTDRDDRYSGIMPETPDLADMDMQREREHWEPEIPTLRKIETQVRKLDRNTLTEHERQLAERGDSDAE